MDQNIKNPKIFESHQNLVTRLAERSKVVIRNASIDAINPHLLVVEIIVPLEFNDEDNIALKLANTKPSIVIPLLKRIYFNENELSIIPELYKYSARKESKLANNQLGFKFMLPFSELTIFAFTITYKLWDLSLSAIQSDSSFVKNYKIESFFYFSVFKNTKTNNAAQEIMRIIIIEDGRYYEKLKRYLRSDLKKELAPLGSSYEYDLI